MLQLRSCLVVPSPTNLPLMHTPYELSKLTMSQTYENKHKKFWYENRNISLNIRHHVLSTNDFRRRVKSINGGGQSKHLGATVTIYGTFLEAVVCPPQLNRINNRNRSPREEAPRRHACPSTTVAAPSAAIMDPRRGIDTKTGARILVRPALDLPWHSMALCCTVMICAGGRREGTEGIGGAKKEGGCHSSGLREREDEGRGGHRSAECDEERMRVRVFGVHIYLLGMVIGPNWASSFLECGISSLSSSKTYLLRRTT